MNMLDLGGIVENYYEVRLLDGKELKLKRPTQAMIESISVMDKLTDNTEILRGFSRLFARILNRNTEGLVFKSEDLVEQYDFTVVMLLVKDYFNYWREDTEKQVNFQ